MKLDKVIKGNISEAYEGRVDWWEDSESDPYDKNDT